MIPATKREYLRQLVDGKNRWSRQLTVEEKALGFLGWHERGYLPHCDFPGLVQFVTFRLVDSLPASCRGEWEHLLAIEEVRERRTQLEAYLDQGAGDCQLRDPHFAGLAEEALLHRHMQTHELLAWCVMPNHVHVLVHVWQTPLWKLIKSWVSSWYCQLLIALPLSCRSRRRGALTRLREQIGAVPARALVLLGGSQIGPALVLTRLTARWCDRTLRLPAAWDPRARLCR